MEKSPFVDSVRDPTVVDPLSPVSRHERKALLAASLLAIALTTGGLTPKRIPVLDIELSSAETVNLYFLLTGVLLYYITGFYIYGQADLRRRSAIMSADRVPAIAEASALLEKYKDKQVPTAADLAALEGLARVSEQARLASRVSRAGKVRVAFDFYLPLIVGLVSVSLVLAETWSHPWARIVTGVVASLSVLLVTYLLWRERKRLVHFAAVRRHRIRHWQFNRLAARFKVTPSGTPEHAALAERLKRALAESLKGPWV